MSMLKDTEEKIIIDIVKKYWYYKNVCEKYDLYRETN